MFDFTYVVCSVLAEHDELDLLDGPSYSSIALGIPSACRSKVLGDNYLNKLTSFGVKCVESDGPRPSTSPAKRSKQDSKKHNDNFKLAKGGDGTNQSTGAGNSNPCVYDPDGIPNLPIPDSPLLVGAFSIYPRIGIISPGQTVNIEITFDPTICENAKEKIRFYITGTNERDSIYQIASNFELSGDSCYPVIITGDNHSIFEEVEVISSLSTLVNNSNNDNNGNTENGRYGKLPIGKVIFAEKERIMVWGAVMCGTYGTKGYVQRVRITNPSKIDVKVKFKITTVEEAAELLLISNINTTLLKPDKKTPKSAKPKKEKNGEIVSSTTEFAFTVQPEICEIPPHEYRYASIYFKPTEMKNYRGVFFAEVDDSNNSSNNNNNNSSNNNNSNNNLVMKSNSLRNNNTMPMITTIKRKAIQSGCGTSLIFDLGGNGTMPCITIEEPLIRDNDGNLIIDFQKVHIDKICKKRLTIMNHGTMPATCIFDMIGSDEFDFSSKNASLTLESGKLILILFLLLFSLLLSTLLLFL